MSETIPEETPVKKTIQERIKNALDGLPSIKEKLEKLRQQKDKKL
ncbi:MAG: hypothetical protein NWE89_14930 [Candidatus Bathyarchaeota archaeon]|nr:hypothetical protein [Candidatus Bathyarchaeota archaeon]